jgi:hypothetical protein
MKRSNIPLNELVVLEETVKDLESDGGIDGDGRHV